MKDWLIGFPALSHESDWYSDRYGHRLGISTREIAEARARRKFMDAPTKACLAFEQGDHTPPNMKQREPGKFLPGDRVRYTKAAQEYWKDFINSESFLWSKEYIVTEHEGQHVVFAEDGHEFPQWLELVS